MDRLFDTVLREPIGWAGRTLGSLGAWIPAVDVSENKNQITLSAELPGVAAEDVELEVSRRSVMLGGDKKSPLSPDEEGDSFVAERRYGKFRRVIDLPADIDTEKVETDFAAGVLTVQLTKAHPSDATRVNVKTG